MDETGTEETTAFDPADSGDETETETDLEDSEAMALLPNSASPAFEDPFEIDSKRKKLFVRAPRFQPQLQICGAKLGPPAILIDTQGVPAGDKLTLKRKTHLDLIKDTIPKPPGSVPPTAIPTWHDLDMSQKIPFLRAPNNFLYYTCGKLGAPFHRCHPYFCHYVELNERRVVNLPYNSLHDPNLKSHIFKPSVRQLLYQQGLINERNEVYCTIAEFNRFRTYLSTLYNDHVANKLQKEDNCWKYLRQQALSVQSYVNDSSGRQAFLKSRRLKAHELQQQKEAERIRKYESKARKLEMQTLEFERRKTAENLMRSMAALERDQRAVERMNRTKCERLMVKREMLRITNQRDAEALDKRTAKTMELKRARDDVRIQWISRKFDYALEKMQKDKQLDEAMRLQTAQNAKKRQRKMEKIREMMPASIEKKKQAERRLWDVVRKFALRWLERVRRRLNAPKDLKHESVWIGKSKGVLDDTLKYLKEISGYEKMDDFVLNIIKLKRQIARQIELEEAEEAKAAKDAEEGEGGDAEE